MSSFDLPKLPEELQAEILGHTDGRTLLHCMQASKTLSYLVNSNSELQYKLELAVSGMIDGLPSRVSIRERLEAIRAYRYKWRTGVIPIQTIKRPRHAAFVETPAAVLLHDGPSSALHVHEFGIPTAGFQSRTREVAGWGQYLMSKPGLSSYTVDVAQCLVAIAWNCTLEPTNTTEYPKCSLVSLANNFPPHQLARQAEFQATLPVVSEAIRSTVEVVGDLLAWHIDHGHGQEGETFVVNWNSGVVVWHGQGECASKCQLLSTRSIIVVDTVQAMLRIYNFDAAATADCPPRPLAEDGLHVLKLHLPSIPDGAQLKASIHVTHPPPYPPDALPMFIPDPSVTVVIVDIRVAAGANDLAAWPKKYLLFVPNETLLAHCEDDAYNSTMFSFGHAYPEGTAELRRPVGLGRSKEVPWEEWGPRGTRMIEAEASTTVLGSKAAIVRWIYCRREYAATVYEALPLADLDPSSDQPVVHSGSSSERPSRETVIPASVYWKEPVRTTYPLRETKFTFDPEEGMAVRGSKVVLTCDGLAFIARHLP